MKISTAFFLCFSLLWASAGFAQQTPGPRQPTIMVMPSEVWANQNGYMTEFDDQGTVVRVPDYKTALQEDPDLLLTISKIGEMFSDRGFPLRDLNATLNRISTDRATESVIMGREGGEITESPLDVLKRTANADILLMLTYIVNERGPKASITFNIQAIDAYTNEQIGAASGTGDEHFETVPAVLLEEAVLSHIDNLQAQMQDYFNDLNQNGRKITLNVRVFNTAGFDLYDECGGEDEYLDVIYDWMSLNAVRGAFNEVDATANVLRYEQVRIPMYDDRGRPQDARQFARQLERHLQDKCPELNRNLTRVPRGLGEVMIILGGR